MRTTARAVTHVALLGILLGPALPTAGSGTAGRAEIRLVLQITVDQLRGDLPGRFGHFRARLLAQCPEGGRSLQSL